MENWFNRINVSPGLGSRMSDHTALRRHLWQENPRCSERRVFAIGLSWADSIAKHLSDDGAILIHGFHVSGQVEHHVRVPSGASADAEADFRGDGPSDRGRFDYDHSLAVLPVHLPKLALVLDLCPQSHLHLILCDSPGPRVTQVSIQLQKVQGSTQGSCGHSQV